MLRKVILMTKKRNSMYHRLDKAERVAIERGLDKGHSCRQIAKDLGRSPSTIIKEIERNKTIAKGGDKGARVTEMPEKVCPYLQVSPHVCNGCKKRHYHCTQKFRCEYCAECAQHISDDMKKSSRMGVDMEEEKFTKIMTIVRDDISRGISPEQIVMTRGEKVPVSTSTLYRWIDRRYAGMSNLELRRHCRYKPRKHNYIHRSTSHGITRSYDSFCKLSDDVRGSTCEMDTVHGRIRDSQCLLTLYMRPFKFQWVLLMGNKTPASTVKIFDLLESVLGTATFRKFFGIILTDNGTEFSDFESLENSFVLKKKKRCSVYYCDVRQSQQKGACERNHVELRKLLPKEQGISFDHLTSRDSAVIMSQLNSQPRASLGGMCPIDMFIAAYGKIAQDALDAFGIERIPFEELIMSPKAIEIARKKRGDMTC
jgi:IS30 family transposase